MAHLRTLALVMSASISTTLLAPLAAGAQTPPAPQPTPISQPSAAQPQSTPIAQPSPATMTTPQALPSSPAAGASPSAAGAAPGASSTTPVGTRGGAGQPPPPIPAVLPPVPSVAPGFNAPREPVPNGDLVGVQQQPFVGLALQDAIGMALQRNTDLAIAQSNRRIANYQIIAAQGAYDVRFQLVPSYEHSVQPAVSAFQTGPNGGPITQDTVGAMTGFQGLTQNGGRYSIGLSGSRVQNNSLENSYDPFYQTALALQVTQPLLRGRAIDQNRLQIQLARNNAAISNAVALNQASNTVVNVSNAYYDLVAAWRNVAIQEQGLRNAQAQSQSNSRLAARGVVAPTDIVEANTQVDVFQDNVFAAIQNVQRLQTQLKSLILANPGDPVWMANLVPTTAVIQVPQEPALDALIASAVANRPEIAQLRAQRLNAESNLAYAKDQLKPQLDLGLSYTAAGFAGAPTNPNANPIFGIFTSQIIAMNELIARSNAANPGAPPITPVAFAFPASPGYQTGGLGQSFQNMLDNRFPTYGAQLTLQIPIGNRTAKADYAIAQEQQKQVAIGENSLLQRIRSESVNAIQGLRAAQYRLVAARSAREAAERVLLGEQRRFAAGTSTTFLVLQRQLDLANQQGRELQAQTDLDKAIVELNRVSGGLFTQNGIDTTTLGTQTLNAAPSTSVLP